MFNESIELRWVVSDQGSDFGYELQYRQKTNVTDYSSMSSGPIVIKTWGPWVTVPTVEKDTQEKK